VQKEWTKSVQTDTKVEYFCSKEKFVILKKPFSEKLLAKFV